jgi:hypothetical protein
VAGINLLIKEGDLSMADMKKVSSGAIGALATAGIAAIAIGTGVLSINDGSHMAMAKTDYVSAEALPNDAFKTGDTPADSVDGVPVRTSCDHDVVRYTYRDSTYTDTENDSVITVPIKIDSAIVGRQISRPEWIVPTEFVPGHMIVCKIFDVDADGNWSQGIQYQYPLSVREDSNVYKISLYPIITPQPPAKVQ